MQVLTVAGWIMSAFTIIIMILAAAALMLGVVGIYGG
jgi:hypothetical protein